MTNCSRTWSHSLRSSVAGEHRGGVLASIVRKAKHGVRVRVLICSRDNSAVRHAVCEFSQKMSLSCFKDVLKEKSRTSTDDRTCEYRRIRVADASVGDRIKVGGALSQTRQF